MQSIKLEKLDQRSFELLPIYICIISSFALVALFQIQQHTLVYHVLLELLQSMGQEHAAYAPMVHTVQLDLQLVLLAQVATGNEY